MDWNRERTSSCCSTQEAARHFWEKYNAPMAVQSDDETWYVVEREFLDTLGMLATHGVNKEGNSPMGVALKDLPLQIRNRQLLSPACRGLARPTKLSLLDDAIVFAQGEKFELVNEEFWRLLAKHFPHDVEVPRRVYRDGYRRRVETQPLVLTVYSATCAVAATPAANTAGEAPAAGAALREGRGGAGGAAVTAAGARGRSAGAGAADEALLHNTAAGGAGGVETCCPRLLGASSPRPFAAAAASPAAAAAASAVTVRGREEKATFTYSPLGEIVLSRGDTLADLRHQVLLLLRNVLHGSSVGDVDIYRGTLSSRNDLCVLEPLEVGAGDADAADAADAAVSSCARSAGGSRFPGLPASPGGTPSLASSCSSSSTRASHRHSCSSRASAGNSGRCMRCGEEDVLAAGDPGAVADRSSGCSCGGGHRASGRRSSGSSDGTGSSSRSDRGGGSSSSSSNALASGSRTASSGNMGKAVAAAAGSGGGAAGGGEAGKTLAEAGFDQDVIVVVAERGVLPAAHVAGSRRGRGTKKAGAALVEQEEGDEDGRGGDEEEEADEEQEEEEEEEQSPRVPHAVAAAAGSGGAGAPAASSSAAAALAAGGGGAWGLRGHQQQQSQEQQQTRGGRERRDSKMFEEEEEEQQDAEEEDEEEEEAREIFKRGGLCGLINVGNTCFLNSAVQCLSKVMPLSYYFLSNKYLADLNEQNVMGTQGRLARAYCNTLREMWLGEDSPLAPRELKWAVGRVREEFLGYNQQDSQELIAFLLDGLHEDLNRVKKKPYYESKIEGGPEKADAEVAELCWQRHKEINDSFIVDCFQGLYRSRLQCPQCKKISKTFDPFMYLSLPVPPDCGTVTFALACDPLLPSGFAFDRAAPVPLDYPTAKQVYLEIVDRLLSSDADQPLTAEEKELLLRHILSSTWLQDIRQLSASNVLMVAKGLDDTALSVYNSDASLRIFRCGDTLKPRFDRHNAHIFAWLLPATVVQELEGRASFEDGERAEHEAQLQEERSGAGRRNGCSHAAAGSSSSFSSSAGPACCFTRRGGVGSSSSSGRTPEDGGGAGGGARAAAAAGEGAGGGDVGEGEEETSDSSRYGRLVLHTRHEEEVLTAAGGGGAASRFTLLELSDRSPKHSPGDTEAHAPAEETAAWRSSSSYCSAEATGRSGYYGCCVHGTPSSSSSSPGGGAYCGESSSSSGGGVLDDDTAGAAGEIKDAAEAEIGQPNTAAAGDEEDEEEGGGEKGEPDATAAAEGGGEGAERSRCGPGGGGGGVQRARRRDPAAGSSSGSSSGSRSSSRNRGAAEVREDVRTDTNKYPQTQSSAAAGGGLTPSSGPLLQGEPPAPSATRSRTTQQHRVKKRRSNSVFRGEQSLASSGTFFALVLPINKASRPPTIEKALPSRWQMPLLLPVVESNTTCEEFYSRVEQAYLYDYSAAGEEESHATAGSARDRPPGFDVSAAAPAAAVAAGTTGGGGAAAAAAENSAGDSPRAAAGAGSEGGGATAATAAGARGTVGSSNSGTRFMPPQQQQQQPQQQRSLLNHAVGLFRSISGHHAASSAEEAAAACSRLILLSVPCSPEDLPTSRSAGGGGGGAVAAGGMLSQSMNLLTNGIGGRAAAAATQPRPLPDDAQLLSSFIKPSAGEFLAVIYADLSALTDSEKYGELESVSHMGALVAPPSVDISDCLRLFSEQERLDENNTWYCSSCKEHVQAFKKLDLWKIPRTLILHLKRFHNISRWNRAKIGTKVTFPFKTGDYLDMKPYILPESLAIMRAQNPGFEPLYELVSVNVHSGDLGGGHYYAYVKLRGRWYEFNDSWIQAVHEHACSSSDAYMLFYRLKQDEPHWTGAF